MHPNQADFSECDILITGATVYSGLDGTCRVTDVSIRDDRILGVEPFRGRAGRVVSGEGMVLCPGFIDVHSHDDFIALLQPSLEAKVSQGVTTSIVGNCGIGAAPRGGAEAWMARFHPGEEVPAYQSMAEYMSLLDGCGLGINVAVLGAHGVLREAVSGIARRPLLKSEELSLKRTLEESLSAGIIGLSSGLIYEPGCYASHHELLDLLQTFQGDLGLYTTHLRNEADQLLEAVKEAIDLAEGSGVRLQLSHHKAHGRNNWGKVKASLSLVDDALVRGVEVALDQYPYPAGSTVLSAIVQNGGVSGENSRLGTLDPEDLVLSKFSPFPHYEGKSLGTIMKDRGLSRALAAEWVLSEDPDAWVIVFAMCEEDIETVMRHPKTLFGSDGIPTRTGKPHPRLYGTFPRILGRYVRERGVLSLGEAISRMTRLSAEQFQLAQRGAVLPGYFADLVLLHPEAVLDEASYEDPRQAPRGIPYVLVNGRFAVDNGQVMESRSGRLLRRQPS